MHSPPTLALRTLLTLLALLTLAPAPAAPPPIVARAISVHDGDTIKVATPSRNIRVRLYGIDAPELAQPYGTSATLELRQLTGATTFTLQIKSRDRYGRAIAVLTLPDGRQVNTILVQSGAAWWYRQYARKAADLMAAQEQARADRRGLWREPNPTPPWTYRATQRARTKKP